MILQVTDIKGVVAVIFALASLYLVFRVLGFIERLIRGNHTKNGTTGDVSGMGWAIRLPARFAMAAIFAAFAYGVLALIVQVVSPVSLGNEKVSLPQTRSSEAPGHVLAILPLDFFMSTAYAQDPPSEAWTYFGYAKDSDLWNYTIVAPASAKKAQNLPDLTVLNTGKAVIQASRKMNFRKQPFGTFTGTLLNVLTPEPPLIPNVTATVDSCYSVKEAISVGFSKIWVKVSLPAVPCPGQ